jgi:hypothetical protein
VSQSSSQVLPQVSAAAQHDPSAQAAEHVRVPATPQVLVQAELLPAQHAYPLSQPLAQSSSRPLHVSDGRLHVPQVQNMPHVCEPTEPHVVVQDWLVEGVQVPVVQPLHAPHVHAPEHMWASLPPHGHALSSTVPAVHSPAPAHVPHVPQLQVASHVRLHVPQNPQDPVSVSPIRQTKPSSVVPSQSSSMALHASVEVANVHAYSQPGTASRSYHPERHRRPQEPPVQTGSALSAPGQAFPQDPQ